MLLATILSGFGAYLLACYVLRMRIPCRMIHAQRAASRGTQHATRTTLYVRLAALLAGIIYAFASNRAIYAALGHYNMVDDPVAAVLCALSAEDAARAEARRTRCWPGLFFALAALAEMIFASFLALFTLIVLLASLAGADGRAGLR